MKHSVVTVGMFDGVHRAHEWLIAETVQSARELSVPSVGITFDPDPHTFFKHANETISLMPLKERIRRMRYLGLNVVWTIAFDKKCCQMSAKEFIEEILCNRLGALHCVVGHDFVFGRDRLGTVALLSDEGKRLGFSVKEIAAIYRRGVLVSSSQIRIAIRKGALNKAEELLGRPYTLFGRVVAGDKRGTRLGYPTANLKLEKQMLPHQGVYAVRVESAQASWFGVMNFGMRPTFNAGLACEVHLLDAKRSIDLYRCSLRVKLIKRLRTERFFPDIQSLQRQIEIDIDRARDLFAI